MEKCDDQTTKHCHRLVSVPWQSNLAGASELLMASSRVEWSTNPAVPCRLLVPERVMTLTTAPATPVPQS